MIDASTNQLTIESNAQKKDDKKPLPYPRTGSSTDRQIVKINQAVTHYQDNSASEIEEHNVSQGEIPIHGNTDVETGDERTKRKSVFVTDDNVPSEATTNFKASKNSTLLQQSEPD